MIARLPSSSFIVVVPVFVPGVVIAFVIVLPLAICCEDAGDGDHGEDHAEEHIEDPGDIIVVAI